MVGTVVGLQPAPMSGRWITPSVTWRAWSILVRWAVLVSVALGLVFGALACASVMAAGTSHGAHTLPAASTAATASSAVNVHLDHGSGHHDAPSDASASSAPEPVSPAHDRDDSGAGTNGHPGMACATAVDLRFPEPLVDVASDHVEAPPVAMSRSCTSDIDPPVPRLS